MLVVPRVLEILMASEWEAMAKTLKILLVQGARAQSHPSRAYRALQNFLHHTPTSNRLLMGETSLTKSVALRLPNKSLLLSPRVKLQ